MENNADLALIEQLLEWKETQEEAEARGKHLIDFVEYVWGVIEPAVPFMRDWAVEAIAEHLEAVSYGQIRRLLMNVPPGFSKSTLTSVCFPAWEWGPRGMPHLRYICSSYSEDLSIRDNLRCRNIVMSDRYQKFWGNTVQMSPDEWSKTKFGTTKTGWKLATSVSGIGTGARGDRFMIDDPNNVRDVESDAIRNATNMWFTEVVPDRLNDQRTSAIIVIQQRTHEDDVSGVALSREMGYTHLMIPMHHDPKRHCVTSIGWEDPRTEDGELAWPDRFPEWVVQELQRDKGSYAISSQYEQSPKPRGGSIIKEDYWQLWEEQHYPNCNYILASLDTAYTAKEKNDPSALTIWGVFKDELENTKVMLLYAWRERLEFHDLVQRVIDTCTKDRRVVNHPRFPVDRVIVEAKASGISVAQELRRLCANSAQFGVELIKLKGGQDKVARVHSIEHLFSERMVYAPDRAFADMVIQECAVFPYGSTDDLVDSTSMAMRYLRDNGFMVRTEEKRLEDEEELAYRGRTMPLYPV